MATEVTISEAKTHFSEHAWSLRSLPSHHRDPFDRLLIAQAQVEGLAIVTADPAFGHYRVDTIWN